MIYIKKDITSIDDEFCIIAHGVNCLGVFGAGVALAIKNKWPDVYKDYRNHTICRESPQELLGTVKYSNGDGRPTIANCYTQVNVATVKNQRVADIHAVEKCLKECIEEAYSWRIDLYLPRIGCGLGGLSWDSEVCPIIQNLEVLYPRTNIFICDI